MIKKYLIIIIFIFTISCGKNDRINWYTNLEEALEISYNENKPLMINFYTEWCEFCKALEKEVFYNKNIANKLQNFVVVKINPENDKISEKISREYNVSGFPTMIFLTENNFILKRIIGYLEVDNFSDKLDSIIKKVDIVKKEFSNEKPTTNKLDILIDSEYIDKSIELYNTLLANNQIYSNDIPKYLSDIGSILFQNNRIYEGLKYFDEILTNHSNSIEIYNAHLYKAVYTFGKSEECIEYLEYFKDKAPNNIKEKYTDFINYIKEANKNY